VYIGICPVYLVCCPQYTCPLPNHVRSESVEQQSCIFTGAVVKQTAFVAVVNAVSNFC